MSISCKQATDYISRKEEGKLSIRQRYQLWRHLAVCYLCKRFDQQNTQIHNSIMKHKHQDQHQKLPQGGKDSILQALSHAENNG